MDVIVIYYFDWAGTRDGLIRWVEAVRAEAEQQNADFLGLYGPSQVKFNWAFIYRVHDQEHFQRARRSLTMPAEVIHAVINYYWPDESFTRDLPKYPPTHFLGA
jgi:hypothetical protein